MRCGKLIRIALGCVLLGCFLLGCQGGAAPDLSEDTWGNTSGNILQTGTFAVSNGAIYYRDPDPKSGGLYRLDQDGGSLKLSDQDAYSINVVDDTVYFLDGLPGRICRVSVGGDDFQVLKSGPVNHLFVSRSAMLYQKGSLMCIANTSAKRERVLAENVLRFVPYHGKIYFSRLDGLYQVEADGAEPVCLTEEAPISLCANSQGLYFSVPNDDTSAGKAGGKVYHLEEDGTITPLASTDDCWNMNVTEQYIFYRDQTKKGALYRMDLDGSNAACLVQGNCVYIQTIKDLVVFYTPTQSDDLDCGYHAANQSDGVIVSPDHFFAALLAFDNQMV